jgi:CubicO group peptidase (beta-lactamase class C family)
MIKILNLLLIIAIVFACNPRHAKQTETGLLSVDSLLTKSLEEWNVPGMAVGIIVEDTLFLSKGYGLIHMSKKIKVTDTTLFGIASLTKSFTALAVGIGQKNGFLSVEDPLKKHLHQFETSNDSLTNSISFVDALSHRTGFSTFSGDLSWYGSLKSKSQIMDVVKNIPVSNGFRSAYGYNNVMFLAAGMALEKATNQNYEDFISNYILSPLDMQFTTFDYNRSMKGENIAIPHIIIDSINKPIEYVDWTNMSPSGGLFSNVQDMLKWARFQWDRDTSIIDEAFLSLQQSLITPQKLSWFDMLNPNSVSSKGYGLGWEVMDFYGHKVLMHNGGLDGMISQLVIVPEKKMAFVVFVNSSSPLPIVLGYELLHRFLKSTKSNYYRESYQRFYASEDPKAFNPESVQTIVEKFDMERLRGHYSDNLMGDASITYNKKNKNMELIFSQAQLFDGIIVTDSINNILLEWKKISSLPNGKLVPSIDSNGAVIGFKIVCPNPDFRFEEVYFKRK